MNDTSEVRKGEEIDTEKLASFLRSELGLDTGALSVRQFPHGSSNLTYCVKMGNDEYVLRRPPFGNVVKTAHDMSREFHLLSKLSGNYPLAPAPLVYCGDEGVIGSQFYLMERRNGVVIRGELPEEINTPSQRKGLCRAFMKNLADLHSLDHAAIGLGSVGKPEGYTARQVIGWSKRYFNSKTDQWDDLEEAIFWLNNQIPEDEDATLVHNDYKFDNIILDPDHLTSFVAVLDWEMATIGSPLMDLGTTLGYWMSVDAGEDLLSMPFNPGKLMEQVSREDLVDMYEESTGNSVSNILFFYVFGTVKIAVIAQQIYFRYARGFTDDPRFSRFNLFVSRLGGLALEAIRKERI